MQAVARVIPIKNRLSLLQERFSVLLDAAVDFKDNTFETASSNVKRLFRKKKFGKYIFVILGVLLLIGGIRFILTRSVSSNTPNQLGVTAPDALTTPVEREFSFQVYDKDKKLSDEVKYTITTVQLTKTIIIKGQRATAVKGRTFLILNLKLVNEFDKSLFLNSRNYVRIQPMGTQDNLAPEIHNDTVEVQPLSTKLTRIGLPVDEGIKEFKLFVGELEGEKEEIQIKF